MDSQVIISKEYYHVYNGRSRHIRLAHGYILQIIKDRVIMVDRLRSNQNLADPLTKGLVRNLVLATSRGWVLSPKLWAANKEGST